MPRYKHPSVSNEGSVLPLHTLLWREAPAQSRGQPLTEGSPEQSKAVHPRRSRRRAYQW